MCERNRRLWGAVIAVTLLGELPASMARAQQSETEAEASDGAHRVTLAELFAHARDNAPRAIVARSRLTIGRAAEEAASPLLPGNPQVQVGLGPRFAGSDSDFELQASLMQPLEIAGERGLRFDLAEATQARTGAELDAAHWSVHQAIHATFHASLVARERVDLAGRLLEFQEELLRIARGRVAAGDASPLTERLAEAEVAQARQTRIAANQRYLALCLSLGELAGWPSERSPPEPAGTLEAPRHPPVIDELLALAREHHPVLAVRRAAVAEARARARLEARDGWPQPSIGVSATREGAPVGGQREWVVMGVVSIPFPFWQRNQAARAAANAQLDIAEAEQVALRRTLVYRLQRLASAVEAAAARAESYGTEVLPRFEENLSLLQRSFELGEIDLLQLSIGRERFLQIQLAALAAQRDYFNAVAALEAEVGTDPWPDTHHERETHQ